MSTPSGSRLHRRTSSAALHTSYTPLVGGPGDIASSLDPAYSSATAPHSRSVSLGYAEVDVEEDEKKDDEGEEKDGLIPRYNNPSRLGSGAGGWRSVPSRSRKRKGGWWKCKLFLLFLIATAVGGLVWYWFFAPPSTRETMEEVKGWWSAFRSGTESAAAAEGTGVGWSGLKVDEINWTTTTTPATFHSLARTSATVSTKSHHVPTARPTSLSTSTGSRFAHVEQAIKNGSLGAYKWHAVLPRIEEEEKGRVIVVGDIHGTHRSLLSLLSHLRFSPSSSSDILLHTGDFPHKSSLPSSLTTISLLRRLGAKGVRGYTDQRVVEWRVWMESVGPLDLTEEEEGRAGAYRVPEGLKGGPKPSYGRLRKPGRPSPADEEEEERGVPQPRVREKRAAGSSWFGWLTGDGEEEFESAEAEAEVVQESSSAASVKEAQTSAVKEATGRRRPFGRPTSTSAFSASVTTPTRSSSAARPSTTTSSSDGSLLGPLYSHLSPSFPSSCLHALNLPLPPPSSGLTWGSPEFDLARHLPAIDFEYLKDLPLTLWVEELGSWVVHAGMVARTNSSALGHAAGGKGWSAHDFPPNAMLDSSNPRAFAPSSSRISRLLRSSSKWSILLEEPNTDPWTLMNLRTLEPTSEEEGGWKVSAKGGRKASRGSRPWWKLWEEEMRGCAKRVGGEEDEEEGGCEEAGIVYGHWAGQGLQVHDHSIGLDTGCVYGRRLSALVVPLSNTSRSSTSSSVSHASKSSLSLSASATATARGSNPKAKGKAIWHGGMQKVTVSAPASSVTSTSSGSSRSTASRTTSTVGTKATPSAYVAYKEDELDYPDSSSSPSSSSSDAANSETDSKKPWWKPWKRAPPQGRPGVAPWEGMEELQVDFDADDEAEQEEMGGMTEVWKGGKKARPTASRTTSSSAVATPTPSAPSLSALLAEAADELEASAFHERRVTLHNGRTGQIVSVDCAGEVEVD
ncbi:Metallophos domain-containing protein [Rhodotorula toruloides]|nr:Metallophos domain-containing protein [Rhodotorula toruloides]